MNELRRRRTRFEMGISIAFALVWVLGVPFGNIYTAGWPFPRLERPADPLFAIAFAMVSAMSCSGLIWLALRIWRGLSARPDGLRRTQLWFFSGAVSLTLVCGSIVLLALSAMSRGLFAAVRIPVTVVLLMSIIVAALAIVVFRRKEKDPRVSEWLASLRAEGEPSSSNSSSSSTKR